MSASTIWNAFETAVKAFADAQVPPLQVIPEGVHGTPPDTARWLETRFFPNQTETYGMSLGQQLRGFCQVTVCERPGSGIVRGLAIAEAVVAAFPMGSQLSDALVPVVPWISSVLVDSDRHKYPVTIRYESRAGG